MTPANAAESLPLDFFFRWERERPGSVFLTQPLGAGRIRHWTWQQAGDEVRRMAAYLQGLGWEPGSRVAIVSKNCAWWIMADLAIWMAGYVTVPVYPTLKPHSIRHILEHSDSRGCFLGKTDDPDAIREAIPEGTLIIPFRAPRRDEADWDAIIAGCSPLASPAERHASDIATIIYTSGTTGLPKGVVHSHGAFAYAARHLPEVLHLPPNQRVLSYLPLAHIVERTALEIMGLHLGFHIFFAAGVETFLEDLHRARPSLFLSVPRLLLKFQQEVYAHIPRQRLEKLLTTPVVNRYVKSRILRRLGLHTVRFAASGAAPLAPDILLWYRRLGLELMEGYGMTEVLITHLPPHGHVRPGYVGTPIHGVEAKLADSGELLIRSPMNMLAYHKDPAATRESFTEDGFFRTGDLAEIDSDQQLKIVGRLKEQFKTSKGKYVAPAPIEMKLNSHPAVEACCLMGAGMANPFAIILLSEEARRQCATTRGRLEVEASLRTRMDQVNAELNPHERLAFLAIVNGPWNIGNGLLTPTLKIRRTALENRYQALVESWTRETTPVIWEAQTEYLT